MGNKQGVIRLVRLTEQAIKRLVRRTVGEDVLPVVDVLRGRKGVSENFLMQQMKMDVNAIRNLLYRLYNEHLVLFTRERDKRRGWYLYYWSLNNDRIRFLLQKDAEQRLERLSEILQEESSTEFYQCTHKCIRLDFATASDIMFRCPECGGMMDHVEKETSLEKLKRDIERLEVQVG